jgi:hypothetical protein
MTTLQAINGSIKKWEGILYEGKEDMEDSDCKLCVKYDAYPCTKCTLGILLMRCQVGPYHYWAKRFEGIEKRIVKDKMTKQKAEVMLMALYLTKEIYVNGDMP